MTQAAPALRDLARQILALASSHSDSPEDVTPVTLKVFERLRLHLATFVGEAGHRAMFSRAFVQAKLEDPWLRELVLLTDGTLDIGANWDSREAARGVNILLAHLLGLINVLVGEVLMLRLVQDVWPTVSLDLSLNNPEANGEVIP